VPERELDEPCVERSPRSRQSARVVRLRSRAVMRQPFRDLFGSYIVAFCRAALDAAEDQKIMHGSQS